MRKIFCNFTVSAYNKGKFFMGSDSMLEDRKSELVTLREKLNEMGDSL